MVGRRDMDLGLPPKPSRESLVAMCRDEPERAANLIDEADRRGRRDLEERDGHRDEGGAGEGRRPRRWQDAVERRDGEAGIKNSRSVSPPRNPGVAKASLLLARFHPCGLSSLGRSAS